MTTPETPKITEKSETKKIIPAVHPPPRVGGGVIVGGSTTNAGSLLLQSSLTCSMQMNKPNWIKNELSIFCSENKSENPHF